MTYSIVVRNVCEALPTGVDLLLRRGVREQTRAGEVLVAPWPVVTTYERPQERVLFSPVRDANPFFHLMESLWMLAGRDDATFLDQYVHDFSSRYAEPDGRIHGAYGRRWRAAFGFDQLDTVVNRLRLDPTSRQAVIQMWDARAHDPGLIGRDDLLGDWRDRPCNTHVYLRVRESVLDLTVCCRSNDIVWGAYGANAVHFSVLQEYLATRIGVGVGTLTQFSNNYHMYIEPLEQLQERAVKIDEVDDINKFEGWSLDENRYVYDACGLSRMEDVQPLPLVDNPATFDEELLYVLSSNPENYAQYKWSNTFLCMAWRLRMAHRFWKAKMHMEWRAVMTSVPMCDWCVACGEWLERRVKVKENA